MQVFDESNRVVLVIVVKVGFNVVICICMFECDGYSVVQLVYGEISLCKVNKLLIGQYIVVGVNLC